jgi:hypothetical protein
MKLRWRKADGENVAAIRQRRVGDASDRNCHRKRLLARGAPGGGHLALERRFDVATFAQE